MPSKKRTRAKKRTRTKNAASKSNTVASAVRAAVGRLQNDVTPAVPEKPRKSSPPGEGTEVVWPRGVETRLGLTPWTRWRWERDGKLPQRDVCIGGRTGWKPATIAAALGSKASAAT